jgi:hypothetical protein
MKCVACGWDLVGSFFYSFASIEPFVDIEAIVSKNNNLWTKCHGGLNTMASMSTNGSIEANGNIVNKAGKGYCWLWSWKLKWSLEDHDVSYAHEGYEWSSYEFEIIYVLLFYLRFWVHGCGCVYGLWKLFLVFVNGPCFWLVFLGFCEWQRWYFLTFHGHSTMIHAS